MKTEQVRIPEELADDARLVCSAFGKSLPEYVTEVLQRAVARDLPRAAKIVTKRAERAEQAGESQEEEQ